MQAFDAWDITQGSANVTIAIVDDAVRLTHQDLAANIWVNPEEIPLVMRSPSLTEQHAWAWWNGRLMASATATAPSAGKAIPSRPAITA